jgi:dienelactone hydrolase
MKASLRGSLCAAALLLASFGTAEPARTQDLAWLGGDRVAVAAQRMDLNGSPVAEPLLGYLARPNASGRQPAVVILHGCGGFQPVQVVTADVLQSFGYVALALDSLGSAKACTGGGRGQVAEAVDAYAALGWLARQNFVDPDRVALLGYSMGAKATLDAVETGPDALEKRETRHFRAAIAYYPGCRDRAGVMTAPTLILIGDDDDWAPASWCRDMMARRGGKGAPVKLVVYPGATHAFDIPAATRRDLGHHLAYDPQATAAAWKEVRAFLHTTLDGSPPAGK